MKNTIGTWLRITIPTVITAGIVAAMFIVDCGAQVNYEALPKSFGTWACQDESCFWGDNAMGNACDAAAIPGGTPDLKMLQIRLKQEPLNAVLSGVELKECVIIYGYGSRTWLLAHDRYEARESAWVYTWRDLRDETDRFHAYPTRYWCEKSREHAAGAAAPDYIADVSDCAEVTEEAVIKASAKAYRRKHENRGAADGR